MNKTIKISLLVLTLIAGIVILVAPIGPMPGIFIGGTETPVPDSWGDIADRDEIHLRVPGTIPRVVIIWVVEFGEELYVVGSQDSGWVKMIGDGAKVQMRAGDNTYLLTAEPLTSEWAPVVTAYADKYRPNYPDIVNSFPSIDVANRSFSVFKLNH